MKRNRDQDIARRVTPQDRGYTDSPPCANVYTIRTGIGSITGSFTWTLKLRSDGSTVSTGTFTIGTSTATTIKTQIDTDIGDGFDLIISGTLPGEILLNPNRGRTSTKYDFVVSSPSLTEAESGWPAFVEVGICCQAGG